MSLQNNYALAHDSAWTPRIEAALGRKADFVFADSGATAASKAQAYKAIFSPDQLILPFARELSNNGTIQTAAYSGGPLDTNGVADADIEFVIDTVWETLANYVP